jgi:hypothetical protein
MQPGSARVFGTEPNYAAARPPPGPPNYSRRATTQVWEVTSPSAIPAFGWVPARDGRITATISHRRSEELATS